LRLSFEKLSKSEKLCDIHIDLLNGFDKLNSKNPVAIGQFCISLFEQCLTSTSLEQIDNFQIELSIELESNSNILQGVPNSLSELLKSIEVRCMPELLVYIPERKIFLPKIEYYACPLPFKILESNLKNVYSYYSEYRELEEKCENCEFSRRFTLGYLKGSVT
jgi:hypothetical protein